MFNLARIFAYTRHVERELRRERVLRRRDELRHECERRQFIDAMKRDAGKSPVFERTPKRDDDSAGLAIGPSAAKARREQLKAKAEETTTLAGSNGHRISIPPLQSE